MSNTIAQFIAPKLATRLQARVAKLEAMNAPEAVVITARAAAAEPLKQVSNIKRFGAMEYSEAKPKSYRRGEGVEFVTETGSIFLIPGPYGLFLTDREKG